MKKEIHPTYFPKAKVTCACGRVFEVGSTKEKIEVEICSVCHPFYTGVDRVVDTAGRVEKFKRRQAAPASLKLRRASKKAAKSPKTKTSKTSK